MKFNWRKLFPLSWYLWNKGYDFNAFIFYVDTLICVLFICILLIILI